MTSKIFAEILTDALDSHSVTPGEVAAALRRVGLSIHRSTLIRWCKGETEPRLDKLEILHRLPDAISMSPAEKREFFRATGRALGFPLGEEQRPYPATITQRIHYGTDDLPPFAGRGPELAALRDLILSRRPVLITGMGGIGKTRLAQELLRDCVGHFAHGCEFLAVTPGQTSEQVIRNAARLLGVELQPADLLPGHRRHTLRRLREQLHGIELLFLIDDVENAEQVRELVRELPGITWVLTARRAGLKRVGVYSFHLALPPPEDAAAIFRAHAGDTAAGGEDEPAAAEIVTGLGGLPIAVRLAAGLLSSGQIATPADLKAWLDEGGILRPGSPAGKLGILFNQLLDSVPPDARHLFLACGAFATRSISQSRLSAVCRDAGIALSPDAWEWLADFSLIEHTGDDRIEMHPLLHDHARSRLRKSRLRAPVTAAYEAHYFDLARTVSESAVDIDRDYRPLVLEESDLFTVVDAFYARRDWAAIRAMWPALSGYLWNAGDLDGYEVFDTRGLEAAEALADEAWRAIVLSELGFVALEREEWARAEDLFGRAQTIHDSFADQVIEQARLRRYRASLAMKQGDLDEALRLFAECDGLLAGLTNPPETRLDEAYTRLHSARMSVHFRLLDDRVSAESAGLAAYEAYRRMAPREGGHRLGEFRLELGDVLFLNGKRDAARQMWEEMAVAQEGLPRLTDHAEVQLRLAYLAMMDGTPALAVRLGNTARRIFARHGRAGSIHRVERLLQSIEAGERPPDFETVISRGYPSY